MAALSLQTPVIAGLTDPKLFLNLLTGNSGLGPRGINRRGDFVFGPLPLKSVIYMGLATKPEGAK